jgi:signal peptidase I
MARHTEGQQVSEEQQISEEQQTLNGPKAPQEQNTKQQKTLEQPLLTILEFFVKLGIVCLTLWLVFTYVFGIRQMHGESMYPRLRDGDLILYYRLEKDYNIGDVVVCKVDGQTCVARIVAQEGDIVEMTDEGQLLVNGNVQTEEIFYPTLRDSAGVTYPYIVQADSYFLLCDYRTVSVDSRSYGAVPQSDIRGKVITIFRRRGI